MTDAQIKELLDYAHDKFGEQCKAFVFIGIFETEIDNEMVGHTYGGGRTQALGMIKATEEAILRKMLSE